jgi:hypothetical protein
LAETQTHRMENIKRVVWETICIISLRVFLVVIRVISAG